MSLSALKYALVTLRQILRFPLKTAEIRIWQKIIVTQWSEIEKRGP